MCIVVVVSASMCGWYTMTSGGGKTQRLRIRLYKAQDGLCFWCKLPMLLIENPPAKMPSQPDTMCTIDHLEPKWHPERGNFNGELRKVVACRKCNNERDRQQLAAIPIELLNTAASGMIRTAELARINADKLATLFPVIPNPLQPAPRTFTFEPPRRSPEPEPLRVTLGEMLQP